MNDLQTTVVVGGHDTSLYVVERHALGDAFGPEMVHYGVVASVHNRDWPGTDSPVTFAVEKYADQGGNEVPVAAWGFFREEDCYLFLTSRGRVKIDVWGLDGEKETVVRDGLKIPDGLVSRSKYEIVTSPGI